MECIVYVLPLRCLVMFGILDSGFGFIYIGDCLEFRSSQLHLSSIIMYIEIVRDKQNECVDTLSTLVDPTIHLTSSLPLI